MNFIIKIWNYLLSTGTLVTVAIFAWAYIRPVLEAKKKHAKTVQEKELLDFTVKLADQAVAGLAGNTAMTGHDKFKAATGLVANSLADKGFNVDDKLVNNAVQAAYEKSDLTPTVDPNEKPQTGVVVHD